MSRRYKLPFLSKKRRIVYREKHGHSRTIDVYRRQSFRILLIGNRIADFKAVQANHSTDIPCLNMLHFFLGHTLINHEFFNPRFHNFSIPLYQAYRLSNLQTIPVDSTDSNSTNKGRVIQACNLHLKTAFCRFWLRNKVNN